jgi:hypothetical protein
LFGAHIALTAPAPLMGGEEWGQSRRKSEENEMPKADTPAVERIIANTIRDCTRRSHWGSRGRGAAILGGGASTPSKGRPAFEG